MSASLFPDLAPPIVPKSERTRYIRQAQAIILRRALSGEFASADDVWQLLPVPEGMDPRVMGDVFGGLVRAGLITHVRHERSPRRERHGGFHQTWRIADAVAAKAYLTALVKSGDGNANR